MATIPFSLKISEYTDKSAENADDLSDIKRVAQLGELPDKAHGKLLFLCLGDIDTEQYARAGHESVIVRTLTTVIIPQITQ